jgi:hypothetical protein
MTLGERKSTWDRSTSEVGLFLMILKSLEERLGAKNFSNRNHISDLKE